MQPSFTSSFCPHKARLYQLLTKWQLKNKKHIVVFAVFVQGSLQSKSLLLLLPPLLQLSCASLPDG
jgi:hypothetical protein